MFKLWLPVVFSKVPVYVCSYKQYPMTNLEVKNTIGHDFESSLAYHFSFALLYG